MLDEKRIKFCCVSTILLFWYFEQGRRQRLLKNFVSYVTVYGYTRTKMILASTRIEKSKNEDRTLITKTHELSDEILFDFRFRWLELPVHEKQLTSGLRLETEVKNMTMHNFRVNSIHPQSFIQIGILVSEILGNTPKMNAILAKNSKRNWIRCKNDSNFELTQNFRVKKVS